jgi:hypothetical protein
MTITIKVGLQGIDTIGTINISQVGIKTLAMIDIGLAEIETEMINILEIQKE